MATHAIIEVYDEEERLVATVYKHWDGGPESVGRELKEFLKDRKVINGIPFFDIFFADPDNYNCANGMHELAAQLVVFLKQKYPIGDVYLVPSGWGDADYVYRIRFVGLNKPAKLEIV